MDQDHQTSKTHQLLITGRGGSSPPQVTHHRSNRKSYKVPPSAISTLHLDWKFWTFFYFKKKKKKPKNLAHPIRLNYHKFPFISEQILVSCVKFQSSQYLSLEIFSLFCFTSIWFILRPKPPHKILFVKMLSNSQGKHLWVWLLCVFWLVFLSKKIINFAARNSWVGVSVHFFSKVFLPGKMDSHQNFHLCPSFSHLFFLLGQ